MVRDENGQLVSVAEFITVRFQHSPGLSDDPRHAVSVAEFITVRFQRSSKRNVTTMTN